MIHRTVRGTGEPVLLIQGVGVQGDGWMPQVEALQGEFACATFDNRGIGKSPAPEGKLSVGQMAEDAIGVMDACGWGSAHVMGHSLGGSIALEVTLAHRERVRSLTLMCTFARGADATQLTPRMLWLGIRSRVGSRAMRRNAFLRIVMPPGVEGDAEEISRLFGHDIADQPPVVMRQLAALSAYDATPRLGELAGIPTLILSGAHDPISRPGSSLSLARGIPGSRHIEWSNASHGLPIQLADEVNAEVLAHLRSSQKAIQGGAVE